MNIDPGLVLTICNYIFYGLIGIVALKAIFGLIRGFWKSLCALIVSIACYVLIIVFNGAIAESLFNMDLSGVAQGASITLNETIIEISTLGELVKDIMIVLTKDVYDFANNPELLEMVGVLSLTFISYVSFIVLILVTIFVVAPILSFVIYNLIFKLIIGKKFMDKHKLRLAGFFTNALKAFISTVLFITPFSAITNSVSKAIEPYDMSLNETNAQLKELVDAYDNSLLAKTFNIVTINDSSFDVAIVDNATSFKLAEDSYTSFVSELAMILDIAASAISEEVINLQDGSIDTANLLNKTFISNTISTLAENPLVTKLIPVVLSIVANMESIKNVVDISFVDWNGIDWSSELSTLDDIYGQFYDLNMMDLLVNGDDINSYIINRQDQYGFEGIFKDIGSSQVLKTVLPYVISSFASNIEGEFAGILPTEVSYYEQVDLGNELSAIYDSVLALSDLARYSSLGRNIMVGDLADETILNEIVNFVLSEDAVNGYRIADNNGTEEYEYFVTTDSQETTGYDPMPLSTNSFFGGVLIEQEVKTLKRSTTNKVLVHKGLLDSKLLLDNLPTLLKSGLSMAGFGEYGLDEDIDEFSKEVNTKAGWTSELDDLLHIVSIVNNNPKLPLDGIDIANVEQVNELKRLTPYIDDSKLVKAMLPKLIVNLLGEQELIFGLTIKDFNFECEHLGSEISNLLDLSLDAQEIMNVMSGENAITSMLDKTQFDVNNLNKLLVNLYSSNIINPIPEEGKMSNFATLLQGVFDNQSFKDMGFNLSGDLINSIDNEDTLYRKSKNASYSPWVNELNAVCNIFATLQDAESMKGFINNDGTTPSLETISGDEIESLILSLADSRLIEPSIGGMFNSFLGDTLSAMHLSLDFESVTDWENEARNLKNVINSIQKISGKISIENIDISKLNYTNTDGTTGVDDLYDILLSVYRLDSMRNEIEGDVVHKTNERFADFIYTNITSSVFSSFINDDNREDVLKDHYFEINSEIYLDQSNKIYVSWDASSNGEYKGELYNVIELVRYIVESEDSLGNSLFFGSDGEIVLSSALENPDVLADLTEKINNIYPFRTIIAGLLDSQISSNSVIQLDGIQLNKMNSDIFAKEYNYRYKGSDVDYISKDRYHEILDRQAELDLLCSIVSNIEEVSSVISNGSTDITSFKPLLQSDAASSSILDNLLNDLHDSKMFNSNKEEFKSSTTLFEDIIKLVLDKSSISSMLYDSGYDVSTQDEKVYGLIDDISDKEFENIHWKTEGSSIGQLDLFIDLLEYVVSIDGMSSFDNIDALNNDEIKGILTRINKSYLLHDALANKVNDIFESVGLNDYLLDGTPKINGHYIDELHLSFNETVIKWDADIEHLVELYGLIKEGFDNLIVNDGAGNITVKDKLFENMMPSLGQIETLSLQRADIIYNIFNKCSISDFISEFKASTSTSIDARRRDLISYLISARIESDIISVEDANWAKEGRYLDKLLNSLLSHKNANFDFEDGENHITSEQVYDIYSSVYTYTKNDSLNVSGLTTSELLAVYETQYERGYFSSEIISSFLEKMINELGSGNIVLPNFRTSYKYYGLNEVEKNGLAGLLDLTQGLLDFNAAYGNASDGYKNFRDFDYDAWEKGMIDALNKMGSSSYKIERSVYLRVDSSNEQQYGYNSIIAERLYGYLIGANHETIDDIENSAREGLNIYNSLFGGNYSESEIIINWDLNDFMVKKNQWFVTNRPFELMVEIVKTINI